MPSLTLFNRVWRFGSDDLVFPGISGVLLRGCWLIVLSTVFGISYNDISECNNSKLVKIYFCIIIPLLLCEFLTEICVTIISMRGSIMETRKRSSITKFIYIRLLLFIPEIILTVAGSIWIFDPGVDCGSDIKWSIRVLVGCQWVVLIVVIVFIILLFDPFGKLDSKGDRLLSSTTAFQQALENQFQNTCFCPGGSSTQQAFSEIARQMAVLFHDVDLVPSDIAAGLILLNREQSQKAKDEAEVIRKPSICLIHKIIFISDERLLLKISDPLNTFWKEWIKDRLVNEQEDQIWKRFDESRYFYNYAMGSYGWPLYVYMNLCCGFCRLCKVCKCGCSHLFNNILIEGDNCCYGNTSGLIKQCPSQEDIEHVFVSFQNEVYQTPFCVSIDHGCKNVIICVRGTLSLKDVVTDLTAETEDLGLDCDQESEEKCEGHKGMTRSANFIMNKLEKDNILEPIFAAHQDYGLVIVGHSLGAGTGAILAILMKKKYEGVRCFAISPPQALNLKAAQYCEDFVTSVIVGNDIVARLSIYSMHVLKNELLHTLRECQLPKYQILLGGCWQILCGCFSTCYSSSGEESPLLIPEDRTSYGGHMQGAHPATQEADASERQFERLFCPGKVIHIIERKSSFEVIHGDRKSFEKIAIAPNMIASHVPDHVKKVYEAIQSERVC